MDAGPSRSFNEGAMTGYYLFATGDLIHCLFQSVKLELKPILSLKDIPTGIAVHGTNRHSWNIIGTVPLLCIILLPTAVYLFFCSSRRVVEDETKPHSYRTGDCWEECRERYVSWFFYVRIWLDLPSQACERRLRF